MVRVRIGVSFLGLYQSLQFNVDGEPRGNLGPWALEVCFKIMKGMFCFYSVNMLEFVIEMTWRFCLWLKDRQKHHWSFFDSMVENYGFHHANLEMDNTLACHA